MSILLVGETGDIHWAISLEAADAEGPLEMPLNCSAALRLVIFAARRTGSSLLVNELRAIPSVLMHGEIFHVRSLKDPEDGWAGTELPRQKVFDHRRRHPLPMLHHAQCHPEGHRIVGVKVFRDHLRGDSWHVLTSWCDICVVLHRRDVRAQYHSLLVARQTGRWKGPTRAELKTGAPIDANDAEFKAWAQNQGHWFQTVHGQLAQRQDTPSVVNLTFEDNLVHASGRRLGPLWRVLLKDHPPVSHQRRH